jgi:thiol-disulfide isomerase/thioredoxin
MSEQAARSYSSMPKAARRVWIVPRWLKEAFVAFAVIAVVAVVASKVVQHFGGKASRAASAMDADELPPVAAPPFSLPTRDGKQLDLSAYRGKVVLLNFWATWCPPCRDEEPSLRQLAKTMDPKRFQLVAVSVDEGGWPVIDKFFGGKAPPYTVALDQAARISQIYGTTKFPESYLIDAGGTLRLKFIGPRNWADPAVFALLDSYGVAGTR